MPTALYSAAACRLHDMGSRHPESPQRMQAIASHLQGAGFNAGLEVRTPPEATVAQLERAHDPAYLRRILQSMEDARATGRTLVIDADTSCSPGTRDAALLAAGAAIAATDAVIAGEVNNAFCAVRPPGHHATRAAAMGFCFFNNVAVAALHALEVHGLKRVAIVDFDVHHGNGTEDILAGDERVLMVSFFQHPLYPGSGVPPAADNMLNVPVAAHTDGQKIRQIVESVWLPRLNEFRPELIFISAGFDAHRDDPLAQLDLIEDDYAFMTRQLMEVAATHSKGRIVSCLEGGYALDALGRSALAHVTELMRTD
jgi:acetoin utilization deacetylase AcuC-like enzyme